MKDLISTTNNNFLNRIDNILKEYYINSNELKELVITID